MTHFRNSPSPERESFGLPKPTPAHSTLVIENAIDGLISDFSRPLPKERESGSRITHVHHDETIINNIVLDPNEIPEYEATFGLDSPDLALTEGFDDLLTLEDIEWSANVGIDLINTSLKPGNE